MHPPNLYLCSLHLPVWIACPAAGALSHRSAHPTRQSIPLPRLLAKGKTRIPPNSSRNSSRKPSEICPRYPLEICTSWPYDYRYIYRYFLLEASIHIFFLYLAFWSYPKPRGTRCTKDARRHPVQLHSGSKKIIEINSIFMYLLNICLMLLIFCVCIIFCALWSHSMWFQPFLWFSFENWCILLILIVFPFFLHFRSHLMFFYYFCWFWSEFNIFMIFYVFLMISMQNQTNFVFLCLLTIFNTKSSFL